MESHRTEGLVVRVTGKEIWVDTGKETAPCLPRGRFRRGGKGLQIVAGDRVEVSFDDPRSGAAIESVLPRRTWLSRHAGGRDPVPRVILANIDVLFLVEALRAPAVSHRFIDRVLVAAGTGHVDVRICLNKIDLVPELNDIKSITSVYESLGYAVMPMSAKTGEGVSQVSELLRGGIYAFVGRSGVGKSSLLNRIAPKLDLEVRDVARKTGGGRHTTTYSQLFAIEGGFVADTPGMQTFGFPGDDEESLSRCFLEFAPLDAECRFHPCTHSHEPECAVKKAVENGEIARTRYESYIDMLREIEDRARNRYS